MATRLFEMHDKLLRAAYEVASGCSCGDGCPGCVGPGIGADSVSEEASLRLLERLVTPTASAVRSTAGSSTQAPIHDPSANL